MRRSGFVLALLLFASPASGSSPVVDSLDARAVAMGGALTALARPLEAARLNPAALSRERGFFGGASYLNRKKGAFDAFSLTVVDNITSPFGGALQYLRFQGEEEREDLSLGLSAGRRGQWWGGTARYVHGRQRGEATWHDVFTFDLAVLFERPGGLRVSVVGTNLTNTSLDFLHRRVTAGVAHENLWGWAVEIDLVRDFDRDFREGLDARMGAEYRLGATDAWALRLGQFWRADTAKDYPSAGVAWAGERFDLGYALQFNRQDPSELLHAFSASGTF